MLDVVHRHFLRLVGVRSGLRYVYVNTMQVEVELQLQSLSSMRAALNLIFLYKLVNSLVP